MKRILFFPFLPAVLTSLFLLPACSHKAEHEITEVIHKVYAVQHPFRNPELNENVFSVGFYDLMSKCRKIEAEDRERVLQSEFPTDKPMLIEGEILAGLYDGYTSFTISRISIKGNTATAAVDFVHSEYDIRWTDQVQLVYENGWKVDNVEFHEKASQSDTRSILSDFIAASVQAGNP